MFSTRGYAATTIRAVAERAEVATGTVFLYARSKRELAVRVFDEDMRRTTAMAMASLDRGLHPLQQLLHIFSAHLRHFAQFPELSRALLAEIAFGETEQPGESDWIQTGDLLESLSAMIGSWQAMGLIHRRHPARSMALCVMSLQHSVAIRLLAQAVPDVPAAHALLEEWLTVLFAGIGPELPA